MWSFGWRVLRPPRVVFVMGFVSFGTFSHLSVAAAQPPPALTLAAPPPPIQPPPMALAAAARASPDASELQDFRGSKRDALARTPPSGLRPRP